MTTLYIWVTPAWFDGNPLDHTWVTTYDNRAVKHKDISAVINSGQNYWYCWGSFHAQGGNDSNPTGFLGSANGNITQANCLVASNLKTSKNSASCGTIFSYGWDGVCHQLANQVLYATGVHKTVSQAGGYWISYAFFGRYGNQTTSWKEKKADCKSKVVLASMGNTYTDDSEPLDEFEQHARSILGKHSPEKLEQLLNVRAAANAHMRQRMVETGGDESAESLNDRYQAFVDQMAEALGSKDFERVFGYAAKRRVTVVDPTIYNRQNDPD